jgi:RES domain-containing protein
MRRRLRSRCTRGSGQLFSPAWGLRVDVYFIPDAVRVVAVPISALTEGWDGPLPILATKEYGRHWVETKESVILRVPSTVIKVEANYIINVLHPEFPLLDFGPSEPFRFDPRLK